jgi:hypothetical protein
MNSFHNFEHASHVSLSANKLLQRIVVAGEWQEANTDCTSKALHEHTYGIASDSVTQFAVVFSALIHDVAHKGVPNFVLGAEEPDLAEKYSNKSLAEQRSVDVAWDLLMLPHFSNLRRCIYQNKAEFQRFRGFIVNSVMATDIFDKELTALRNARWAKAFHQQQDDSVLTKEEMDTRATIVVEYILQASDVAHTMQHWHIYIKWNERLFMETYNAFIEGRTTKDPCDGWYGGELWFFDNWVIPLARKLHDCGVFGVSSDEYLTYAQKNRAEWERKGHDLTESFILRAKSSAVEKGAKIPDRMESVDECSSLATSITEVDEQTFEEETCSEAGSQDVNKNDNLEVFAPPGKLGISLDFSEGVMPIVEQVQEGSPLLETLLTGDCVTEVDGISTANMNEEAFVALLGASNHEVRRLTIKRCV